ncbi:Ankyrin repeat domain-containing protein 65 [Madurella mycetomatis]|uniref:Ankyrin repeat domain-containing protein 65 n=1 Tax=Madurella mycetomatis TaxID=100816 RepID=A0A175W7K9_9PEZI|nr:Ankyrin repeat domain-containing protein 65 [Madurella mycetomatis]
MGGDREVDRFLSKDSRIGKTILTAIIINKLITDFSDNRKIGLLYLYCGFRRSDEQKLEDLLASLLKQLAQGHSSLPESMKSLYDKHEKDRARQSFNEILSTLRSVEITASDEDVKHYIGGQIEHGMPKLRDIINQNPQLEKDIKIGITNASKGMSGHEAVVALLLRKGANIEAKDNYCETPLHRASWYEREAVVALLLEKGANIEAKDNDGWTPLLWAAWYGRETVAALLLEKGANTQGGE